MQRELLCFTLWPLPLVPSWGTPEKNLYSPLRREDLPRTVPTFLAFPQERCLSSLFIFFLSFCWTLSSTSIPLWYTTQYKNPELDTLLHEWPHQCWAERKDQISFNQLSVFYLIQPSIPLAVRAHCSLMFNLVSTRLPVLSQQICFPAEQPLSFLRLFLPRCRTYPYWTS